ncbi:BZ3500_MvSof-1268-A1-R1_Chr3-1g05854 [Microbotryum saponariae]|uniref:BZ3500_MvSof-1268-A1-R1_Chr3-1g05854 protein n=1 Tax=Microbotryum saponariae TaxID=289078 RepID=A0A2X0N1X2_9BASI|nr:BZ3500_MvSof-1268-A1-R1_Chr3-1g05854 [Microbotryum saponariae]SDA05044.1 BZ3501_MvSof-1269-A2-R1_Chr3-1g05524 [Microbotryum saponariae]
MPSRKRAFSPPLEKGQACITCKARKVKCDAKAPACTACLRTAAFEGRSADSVHCCYTQVLRKSRKNTGSRRLALKKRPTQLPAPSRHMVNLPTGASSGELDSSPQRWGETSLTRANQRLYAPLDPPQTSDAASITHPDGVPDQSQPPPTLKIALGLPELPPLPPLPSVAATSQVKVAPGGPEASATHSPLTAATGVASAVSAGTPEPLSYPIDISTIRPIRTFAQIAESHRGTIAALPAKPLASAVNWSSASLPRSSMSLDESDAVLALLETEMSMKTPSPTFSDSSSSFGSPQSTFWSDFSADDTSHWSCTPSPPPFAECGGISFSEPPSLMDLPLPLDHQSLAQWFPLPSTPSLELGLREWVW